MSKVIEIKDAQFATEVLNSEQSVLAYFWASWCGPCRLVSPSLDSIAGTYGDRLKVVKLEVDPNPKAVAHCKVEGVPALRLFAGGELIASHEGAITREGIIKILDRYL